MSTGRAQQTVVTITGNGGLPPAPFEENLTEWRTSRGNADRRAQANDETLEICAHCECEVDVDQPAHRPNCQGIGRPRASSATTTVAPRILDGRELLDRMDAGLPLTDDPDTDPDGPIVDDEPLEDEPVLGEVAAVGDFAESGTAGRPSSEPERAATTPSPDSQEAPMAECKIDGCDGDASGAPKAGPTARLCADHRGKRSAELSAHRTGKPRGAPRSGGTARPGRKPRTSKPAPEPAPPVLAPLPPAPEPVVLELRDTAPAGTPLSRLLSQLPRPALEVAVDEYRDVIARLEAELAIVTEALEEAA